MYMRILHTIQLSVCTITHVSHSHTINMNGFSRSYKNRFYCVESELSRMHKGRHPLILQYSFYVYCTSFTRTAQFTSCTTQDWWSVCYPKTAERVINVWVFKLSGESNSSREHWLGIYISKCFMMIHESPEESANASVLSSNQDRRTRGERMWTNFYYVCPRVITRFLIVII